MQVNEFDDIVTADGRKGSVCEVLEQGKAYLVDFPRPMDNEVGRRYGLLTFDTELVRHDDIVKDETTRVAAPSA